MHVHANRSLPTRHSCILRLPPVPRSALHHASSMVPVTRSWEGELAGLLCLFLRAWCVLSELWRSLAIEACSCTLDLFDQSRLCCYSRSCNHEKRRKASSVLAHPGTRIIMYCCRCDCPRNRKGQNCEEEDPSQGLPTGCTRPGLTRCAKFSNCLNRCNHRGTCVLGFCHCLPGRAFAASAAGAWVDAQLAGLYCGCCCFLRQLRPFYKRQRSSRKPPQLVRPG